MNLMNAVNDATAAIARLEKGDSFKGVSPMAIEHGYPQGTPAYRLFVQAALDAIEARRLEFRIHSWDSLPVVS